MTDSIRDFVAGALRDYDAADAATMPSDAPLRSEVPNEQMGLYTLIEPIGEGGFGTVWRAAQSQPVKREVALKILKVGMDTMEVVARFRAERQALAVMDHPSIAKVLDAGASPSGRPYFVMDLVNGLPLTQYCQEKALSLPVRLMLFVDVCRAIKHAHQKGVIHRDLKPSNILVTESDGQPLPKVIDFGIAKAIGEARLDESMLVTRADLRMGTPAYMSPEQAEPGMDIDTRADIYSLGVVMYEMLTGEVPNPVAINGKANRSRDPQRPSTRIRSFEPERVDALATAHQLDAATLLKSMNGDLDWIVMKAIEQDRTRRYDSAEALGDDVLCFLRKQPISARPPTPWYLLKRFTQRNKLAVSAAAIILLTLIAGITTSTWMYFNEKRALVRSQQVSKFLKKVLAQAGVYKSLGRDATMMREILDDTAKTIGADLADQPAVQAEIRTLIGRTYEDINEFELGVAQTGEAVRLLRTLHLADDSDLANALLDHASLLEALGKLKEAEVAVRECLAMFQRLHGEQHTATGMAHALLAWTLTKSGRAAEGEASALLAMDLWRKSSDKVALNNAPRALSIVYSNTKRGEKAVEVKREELEALKKLHGPEHPNVHNCLDNLGFHLVGIRRFDEAEPYLLEALKQGKKFYQDRDPVADHAYACLAQIAASRKDWDVQLKYARESMAAAHRVFPARHRYHREGTNVLTRVLLEHAERCADEAWKTKNAPLAAKALGFIDELRRENDFAAEAKASEAWLDGLRGRVLMLETKTRDEGQALIARGIEALKKKAKPTAEDAKRLKKAAAWQVAGE